MAKNQANVQNRIAESETLLEALRRSERNPNLADGELEFRANLVSFFSLARSCVSMVGMSKSNINNVLGNWTADDVALFHWFREMRDSALKEGNSILKIRTEMLPEYEHQRRYPRPQGWHEAYQPIVSHPPGTPPPTIGANFYELDINGTVRPAIEVCELCLGLIRRFLQDCTFRD